MRRCIQLIFITILLISFVSSGAVSVSPAKPIKEFFRPHLTKTFTFEAGGSDPEESGVKISFRGDLKEYASSDKDYILGEGVFKVKLELPEKIDKPGENTLLIGFSEITKDEIGSGSDTVGTRTSILIPVRIFVPYPGKYLETKFSLDHINFGENASYKLDMDNLGSEVLNVKASIQIMEDNESGKVLISEEFNRTTLDSKKSLNLGGHLNTEKLVPGSYFALATIDYGKIDFLNKTFRVGEFSIEILDYDFQFESKKINPFNIIAQNKWNMPIKNVYSEISIVEKGVVLEKIKSSPENFDSWEIKNLTGFLDATNISAGRYIASMDLEFENASNHRLVAIYIYDPVEEKDYTKFIIYISLGVILIFLMTSIYLILKVLKLKRYLKKNHVKIK